MSVRSTAVIPYLHFSSARRALVYRIAAPVCPDTDHLRSVMIVIAIGFLEFCHRISPV
jgi:hypothetical protein